MSLTIVPEASEFEPVPRAVDSEVSAVADLPADIAISRTPTRPLPIEEHGERWVLEEKIKALDERFSKQAKIRDEQVEAFYRMTMTPLVNSVDKSKKRSARARITAWVAVGLSGMAVLVALTCLVLTLLLRR